MNNTMKWKKQLLYIAILLALIFLSFSIIFKANDGLDFATIWDHFVHLDPFYVVLAFLGLFGYIAFEGISMQRAARVVGEKFGFFKGFGYACIELYFAGITPSATGGQPAAIYYMAKDGISGSKATVINLLNTIQYTTSLIFMGLIASIYSFDLITDSGPMFLILYIIGVAINIVFFLFCIFCVFSIGTVRRVGIWGIALLCKMHLCKHRQKKLERFETVMTEYAECISLVKKSFGKIMIVFCTNVMQRVCSFSIAFFVYKAFGFSGYSYFDLLSIQTLSAVAVNSLPLPGATGAAEGVFMRLYASIYGNVVGPAMFITRGISFYSCFIFTALFTLSKSISGKINRGHKKA